MNGNQISKCMQVNQMQGGQNGTVLFQGKVSGIEVREESTIQGGALFAGNLDTTSDSIQERKAFAHKQAMKVVMDTYDGDKSIDDTIEECKENAQAYKEEAGEAIKQLKELKELRKQSKEVCSQSEYKEACVEYDEMEKVWQRRADDAKNAAMSENHTVEGIKLECLKSNPMVTASNKAADILEAASKKAVKQLMDQAKDTVDKKMEEDKEKEDKLREKQEENEKLENETEPTTDTSQRAPENAEELQTADIKQDAVKQQIQTILEEQKILDEDIKGMNIDASL
ncbi:MAG: hypothetical protein ACERKN_07950 [Velocimicrobium sp.]